LHRIARPIEFAGAFYPPPDHPVIVRNTGVPSMGIGACWSLGAGASSAVSDADAVGDRI